MEISIPGRYLFDYLSGIAWGDLLRNRNIPFKSFAYTVKKRLRRLGSEGLYRETCS